MELLVYCSDIRHVSFLCDLTLLNGLIFNSLFCGYNTLLKYCSQSSMKYHTETLLGLAQHRDLLGWENHLKRGRERWKEGERETDGGKGGTDGGTEGGRYKEKVGGMKSHKFDKLK